jgi:hypothetical protein
MYSCAGFYRNKLKTCKWEEMVRNGKKWKGWKGRGRSGRGYILPYMESTPQTVSRRFALLGAAVDRRP